MDARVVTMTPKPGHLDVVAAFFDEAVVAEIAGQPGSAGFVLLRDESNARVLGVSLWESNTAAQAAKPVFLRHMSIISEHLAAPPTAVIAQVAASSAGVLSH